MCWKRGWEAVLWWENEQHGWDEHPKFPLQSGEWKWQLCGASYFSLLSTERTLTSLGPLKLRELNPTLGDAVWHIFYASPELASQHLILSALCVGLSQWHWEVF